MKLLDEARWICLYHKSCGTCNANAERFEPLYQAIRESGKRLDILTVRRLEYDMTWQARVKASGIEPPVLHIFNAKGEEKWISLDDFMKKYEASKKRKNKKPEEK